MAIITNAINANVTTPLPGVCGGTGVNNGVSTLTYGGNTSFTGAFTFNGNLTANTNVTFPVSGTLATVGGTVSSTQGTASQVLVNGTSGSPVTGAITLTTPQNIATTSAVQFNTVQFNSNNGLLDSNGNILLAFSPQALAVNYITLYNGATGVNPALLATGSDTNINIGFQSKGTGQVRLNSANTTAPILFQTGTSIQHITAFNFADTAQSRTVTFQDSSGTVAWLTDIPSVTPSALTKTDDTNVTLTLGGFPTVALLAAASLTLGWTGQLGLTRGGTGASLTASNGGIIYSTASAMAVLAGTATANQILMSGSSSAPSWSTSAYPSTLGTGVATWMTTPSSANLATAMTTKTGTAGNLVFSLSPTIQTPAIVDSNAVNALAIGTTASAVNYLTIFNRSAGFPPYLSPTGTDTDIGILFNLKGAGILQVATTATSVIRISSGTAQQHASIFAFANTSATRIITFPDYDGTVSLINKANGTESANAVTASGTAGVITTSSLTTAGAGSYAITWTNTLITTASQIFLTIQGGTNTVQEITFKCVPGSGSATLTIYNNTVATALNGTILIGYLVV